MRHWPQREDQAVSSASSQSNDNLAALLKAADRRQLTQLFNLKGIRLGEKARAAWPLSAATLKQQAMNRRRSGHAVSGKSKTSHLLEISQHQILSFHVKVNHFEEWRF